MVGVDDDRQDRTDEVKNRGPRRSVAGESQAGSHAERIEQAWRETVDDSFLTRQAAKLLTIRVVAVGLDFSGRCNTGWVR